MSRSQNDKRGEEAPARDGDLYAAARAVVEEEDDVHTVGRGDYLARYDADADLVRVYEWGGTEWDPAGNFAIHATKIWETDPSTVRPTVDL